jgi:hypothetical protein
MKKGLVIAGVGSKEAFAGGFVEYQINKKGDKYDLLVGTSSGSLLSPNPPDIGTFDKIKEAITGICQQEVFSYYPILI